MAGFMLMTRYQLYNHESILEEPIKGHATLDNPQLFAQLSYTGYKDAAAEMLLLCKEEKERHERLCILHRT